MTTAAPTSPSTDLLAALREIRHEHVEHYPIDSFLDPSHSVSMSMLGALSAILGRTLEGEKMWTEALECVTGLMAADRDRHAEKGWLR